MPASAKTTLYLRGVPRAVVREAKAAAAREGVTLARWVTARLSGAAGDPSAAQASGGDLAADLAWYEANRGALEAEYGGKYVAIVAGRVIDSDTDFERLARRVFAVHGDRPVCMPLVGRSVVRVRSPRRTAG